MPHRTPFVKVPLTRGKVALVSPEDADRVADYRWRAVLRDSVWYAVTGRAPVIYLHRFLVNAPEGLPVDHDNRDGLDNRRSNIMVATSLVNALNARLRTDNRSGFRGVSWHACRGRWRADIRAEGRRVFLGYFDSAVDAALAYDDAARLHFGDIGTYNFPRQGEHGLTDARQPGSGPS